MVRGWFGRPAGTVALWLLTAYAAVCWGMWCWSVRGKRRLWVRLLDRRHLTGTERVLELGPGRGAVLVEAARRVPRGHAVGIDLWRTQDQTGNTPERLLANAAAAGGRIVVPDYRDTGHHADLLRAAGARRVVHSGRSWRLYPPVRVVHVKRPQVRQGIGGRSTSAVGVAAQPVSPMPGLPGMGLTDKLERDLAARCQLTNLMDSSRNFAWYRSDCCPWAVNRSEVFL